MGTDTETNDAYIVPDAGTGKYKKKYVPDRIDG
jgi:hypothetical protein